MSCIFLHLSCLFNFPFVFNLCNFQSFFISILQHNFILTHHHCMRRWSRSSSGRLIRRSQSPPPIMDENEGENVLGELNPQIDQGDNQSQHGHDQN